MTESKKELTNCQFVKDWIEKGLPLENLDQEATFVIPGPKTNPVFGTFQGLEGVKTFFKLLDKKLLASKFKIIDCITEGNQVVVLINETITRKDEPSTHYLNHTAWLLRLNDDQKIVYLQCYDDTLLTSQTLA